MIAIAAVQARMGSERFPGKVMARIAGRPMLQRIVDRLRYCRELDGIAVTTGDLSRDDVIADFAEEMGVPCYRGPEQDLVTRLGDVGAGLGGCRVRITADCPLVDPHIVDGIVAYWRAMGGRHDYVSNVFPRRTFPDGLDVELLSSSALERLHRWIPYASHYRETLTAYIWEHEHNFEIAPFVTSPDRSELRWTVDYPDDLPFVESVYSKFGETFSYHDVLRSFEHPAWGDARRDSRA